MHAAVPDALPAAAPTPDALPAAAPAPGSSRSSGTPEIVPPEPVPATDQAPAAADPGIGYIFEHTRGRKCLVFCNSREEAETVTTTLRQYCEAMHEPERFLIHHGNLSAAYRLTAEEEMKEEDLTSPRSRPRRSSSALTSAAWSARFSWTRRSQCLPSFSGWDGPAAAASRPKCGL